MADFLLSHLMTFCECINVGLVYVNWNADNRQSVASIFAVVFWTDLTENCYDRLILIMYPAGPSQDRGEAPS